MNLKRLVFWFLASVFLALSAVYIYKIGVNTPDLYVFLTNILYLFPPLIAVYGGIYAVKKFSFSNIHGVALAFLTAGILFLGIGEIIWFYYHIFLNVDPYPSIADVFYLGAYPLIFIGIVNELRLQKFDWKDFNKLYLFLIILVSVILATIVSYFGIYLAYKPDAAFLENAIAMAYGIADLILIIPSLFILKLTLDYRGGKLFNSWLCILIGLLLTLVGDILFAIYTDQYSSGITPYNLIDLAWIAAYLFFAYGFFNTGLTITELQQKIRTKTIKDK